jgi:hypothetical protein
MVRLRPSSEGVDSCTIVIILDSAELFDAEGVVSCRLYFVSCSQLVSVRSVIL